METLVKFASAGARELLAELLLHPSLEVRAAVVSAIRHAARRDLARRAHRGRPAGRGTGAPGRRLRGPRRPRCSRGGAGRARWADRSRGRGPGPPPSASSEASVGRRWWPGSVSGPPIRTPACAPRRPGRSACSRAADAAPDFLRLLRDPRPEVREAGAHAAARRAGQRSDPRADRTAGRRRPGVRQAAVEGLGRPHPIPQRCRRWSAPSEEPTRRCGRRSSRR